MSFSSSFYKTIAVCAAISGLLFVIMWILGLTFVPPINTEGMMTLTENAVYPWYLLSHTIGIFFLLATFLGITAKKLDKATGLAVSGFVFTFAYFLLQLVSNGIKFKFLYEAAVSGDKYKYINVDLKPYHLENLHGLIGVFSPACMLCALVALLLYGFATWRGKGLERIVSIFFLLGFISLALYAIGYVFMIPWLFNQMSWTCWLGYGIGMFIATLWLRKAEQAS